MTMKKKNVNASGAEHSRDLCFVIMGMKFKIAVEDGYYDADEQRDIIDEVNMLSEEMHIDASYVDREKSKHSSTFMLDDGWTALCELIRDSEFCQRLHPNSFETVVDAFCMMGKCYIYECLSLKHDVKHIFLDVDTSVDFDVAFLDDAAHAWTQYKGKWQTWRDNVWSSKK